MRQPVSEYRSGSFNTCSNESFEGKQFSDFPRLQNRCKCLTDPRRVTELDEECEAKCE